MKLDAYMHRNYTSAHLLSVLLASCEFQAIVSTSDVALSVPEHPLILDLNWLQLMSPRIDRLLIVRKLLMYQLAGCIVISIAALYFGWTTAYSALLGGLICLVPNCYFAFRVFRFQGARAAQEIVRSFYVGEAGKLLLTAILFAIVFSSVRPINALALFMGFVAIQLVNWLVPFMQNRPKTKMTS